MTTTDFDDLLQDETDPVATAGITIPVTTIGTPIESSEVQGRLAPNLFLQLSEGDDAAVIRASERATLHVGTIAARLGKALDLDDRVSREIVLNFTIYELHMALGHEAAGKEYRMKGRDLIVAAFGEFPESGSPAAPASPAAAVAVSPRRSYP